MMKEKFTEPEIELIEFDAEDIITTSPGSGEFEYDPWETPNL